MDHMDIMYFLHIDKSTQTETAPKQKSNIKNSNSKNCYSSLFQIHPLHMLNEFMVATDKSPYTIIFMCLHYHEDNWLHYMTLLLQFYINVTFPLRNDERIIVWHISTTQRMKSNDIQNKADIKISEKRGKEKNLRYHNVIAACCRLLLIFK